jgi:transposase-like protein
MGGEIDLELRFQAEEAYICGQVTLEQLARKTGISETQLGRWCAEEGWREKRREYRAAQSSRRQDTVALRSALVKKALGSLNPMDVFAVTAIEKLMLQAEKSAGSAPSLQPVPLESAAFKTVGEAVAGLEEAIVSKLQRMIDQPDAVNLAALKDVKQCFELLEKMKIKAAGEAAAPEKQVPTEDRLKEIREMLKF